MAVGRAVGTGAVAVGSGVVQGTKRAGKGVVDTGAMIGSAAVEGKTTDAADDDEEQQIEFDIQEVHGDDNLRRRDSNRFRLTDLKKINKFYFYLMSNFEYLISFICPTNTSLKTL